MLFSMITRSDRGRRRVSSYWFGAQHYLHPAYRIDGILIGEFRLSGSGRNLDVSLFFVLIDDVLRIEFPSSPMPVSLRKADVEARRSVLPLTVALHTGLVIGPLALPRIDPRLASLRFRNWQSLEQQQQRGSNDQRLPDRPCIAYSFHEFTFFPRLAPIRL